MSEAALGLPGEVGGSMADFAGRRGTYFDVVYGKGGAALLAAREAAGAEAFDAALRCYVDANAWTHRHARPTSPSRWPTCPRRWPSSTGRRPLDKDDLPALQPR